MEHSDISRALNALHCVNVKAIETKLELNTHLVVNRGNMERDTKSEKYRKYTKLLLP